MERPQLPDHRPSTSTSIDENGNRWHVDHGVRHDSAPHWIDIPGSDAETTSYKVTGLKHGYYYRFQLRAVDTSGNESPATGANHGPHWLQGGNYGFAGHGDEFMTPYEYKTHGPGAAAILGKMLFYDLDGDKLTYRLLDDHGGRFTIDGEGRIVTTRWTGNLRGTYHVTLCVEATEARGLKVTRCIGMDFQNRYWPESGRFPGQ